jgi:ATP-binding cassette subfamily B protein
MKSFRWLAPYVPSYLKLAVPAWICLLAEVFVDLSLPTLLATLVNTGIAQRDTPVVLRLGLLMFGLALVGLAFGQTRNWLSTKVSQDFGTRVRADLFRKVQRLSMASAQKVGAASLITRLTQDVTQMQNMSFMLTRVFIRAPLLLLGSVVMAFLLNPGLAMILLAVIPLLSLLIVLRIRRGMPLFRRVQQALDKVNGVMREFLAGVRVVKVFNRHDYEQAKFDRANQNLTGLGISAARAMATIMPLMLMLMNGSILLVLYFGGVRVSGGRMQVGDIIAFINYFLQILHAMMMVSWIFTAGVRAKTSSDRIAEVFALPDGMPVPEAPLSPGRTGSLEMRDVSFVWPEQREPVLQDITFSVKPGQTVAIIGATGSGKSSLVNLFSRFHDVSRGTVLVDGVDVRQFALKDLRGRVAMVPQQAVLFSGTIRDNLRWGNPQADETALQAATHAACADEFIPRLEHGYDTWIGQGGVNLSGGQKQRLSIARALLCDAPVLVMDDSTSAIDMKTEALIRKRLRAYARDLTVLIVAQRIHSVMDADQILVLDEGRLVGLGTHKDLLETCDVYRDIYRSQMGLDRTGREVV